MPPHAGQKLLHYRLTEKIGEGGMGVVWKAVDSSLEREVAIKILPDIFAADPERLARFEREAKLLASLSHPNIAAIYGLHEDGSTRFLAMELADGEELSARLSRGALPMRDALEIARQIAEGIEAAHEIGIIHRDLKPANVKLTADGKIKLLDFGLAKALDPASTSGRSDPMASPTITSAGSVAGMILGTAAYMSPEQARGKPLDRRTDLWSFGCVLYEMLTGRLAFGGETVTDVLSAVISRDPDRELLPPSTPPALRRLLDRCLAKEARLRLADAASARLEIDDALRELREPEGAATGPGASRAAGSWIPWSLAAVALTIAVASWLFEPGRAAEDAPAAPKVIAIESLTDGPSPEHMPALSPDGTQLAYVARDGVDFDIFLLRVGGKNPINLTADHDGWDIAPAFSPDGERIAFASEREGGGLFVMGATGESPRRVATEGTHPSWSPDGKRLVAATEQVPHPYTRTTNSRLFVIDLSGGPQRDLPVVVDGVGPRWSPDGRLIAYWNTIGGQRDLWTIPVDGGEPVKVTDDAYTDWEPMWAERGAALYFHSDRGGSADLWRIPVDPLTGKAGGSPTPLTIGVTPVWESSLSSDGTRLIGAMRATGSTIRSYDFDPRTAEVQGDARTLLESGTRLTQPDLSADGRHLAFTTTGSREIVTTLDLQSGAQRSLTDDGFRNRGPEWSPDGDWIAIYSNRGGSYEVWLMRPEGSELRPIFGRDANGPGWSPDGSRISVNVEGATPRCDDTVFIAPDPAAKDESARWIEVGEPLVEFGTSDDWSPDGKLLLGRRCAREALVVHDLEAGEWLSHEGPPESSGAMAWLPDSRRVVLWHDVEQSFTVWDVRTNETKALPGLGERPGDVLLSPDGRTLYVVEQKLEGEIWMLTLEPPRRE